MYIREIFLMHVSFEMGHHYLIRNTKKSKKILRNIAAQSVFFYYVLTDDNPLQPKRVARKFLVRTINIFI